MILDDWWCDMLLTICDVVSILVVRNSKWGGKHGDSVKAWKPTKDPMLVT